MPNAKETRKESTKLYICSICGLVIISWLPKGLKGAFMHLRCIRKRDAVLDAEVIDA